MTTEQQNGQEAVALTDEQQQAIWNEVKAERDRSHVPDDARQVEATPAAEPPADPPADPPAPKAPTVEELQAQIAEMKQAMERTTRNSAGAIGGLKEKLREHEAALAEARQALAQRTAAPTQDQVAAAAKSGAKWDALKADYPEWAEAIEERFGTQNAKGDPEAIRQVEERAARELAQARREAEQDRKDFVEALHPGWEQLCKTKEFKDWMAKAGDDEHRLAASTRASDAVKLLNRFKYGADTAPGAQLPPDRTAADVARDRQQRLATAVTAPRGTTGSAAARSPDDMTAEEYWEYLKVQRARQQGAR